MFRALKDMFSRASESTKTKSIEDISEIVGDSGRRLKESALDDLLHELELGLLEADVALPIAEEITRNVRASLSGKRIDRSFNRVKVHNRFDMCKFSSVWFWKY